jgi:outer membrane receptor for ferrienterochelin and colicins
MKIYLRYTFWLLSSLCLIPAQQAKSTASDAGGIVELDRVKVVTTATRTERLRADVPVRTEVLLREDMQLRTSLNFSQAVELLNGLRVEANCQNCNTAEVQLLGLGGAYNQILFDGVPLLSTLAGVYGIEQIPAAFVDRLEVVKGGGSSLYGAGAVAGVINLVPVAPRRRGGFFQTVIEMQRGEPLYFTAGRGDFLSPEGRLGLSVVAQGSSNDAIDYNGDGYSEITRKDQAIAGMQLWLVPNVQTRVRANYQYTGEERRGGNRFDQLAYLANIAEVLVTRYHRGGLMVDRLVSPNFDFRLGYAFAYIEWDSFYGGLGAVVTDPAATGYDAGELDPFKPGSAAEAAYNQYGYTENPLHYLDAQFNWRAGDHALAFGVQHRHESVHDENRDFTGRRLRVTVDDHFRNTGVFVQDEWAVSPALDLVLGARVDRNSMLDEAVFSPRVAAAWAASDTVKLRVAAATGFRAPEGFSEDLHIETLGSTQVRIRNATGLGDESSVSYLAGIEWRDRPMLPRWVIDANVSLTNIKDTFLIGEVQTEADGSLFQERTNAAGSRIEGFEANLSYQAVREWRFTAGLSHYRSRFNQAEMIFDDTPEGGSTVIATRNYLKTPNWGGVLQGIWTMAPDFDLILGTKYTGRMDVLNNNSGTLNRVPDFWVLDLGLMRHFDLRSGRHLDLSLGVRNLFDQRQRDLESGPNRDSDYVYGPRFARAYYLAAKYEF